MDDADRSGRADTIQALADLHKEHHRRASAVQRFANHTTGILGRPGSLATILLLIVAWMCANSIAIRLGFQALEAFPFPDLAFFATIAALLVTLLILTTQRHADELADKRAQLTLQIAILNEEKSAKIIELLEEQRRDNPLLASRTDHQADAMSQPSDPAETLDKIDRTTL